VVVSKVAKSQGDFIDDLFIPVKLDGGFMFFLFTLNFWGR